MNSSSRSNNLPTSHFSVRNSSLVWVRLAALMFGLMFLIGSSGRAFAQDPTSSDPGEWTSLVDPAYNTEPANDIPAEQRSLFNKSASNQKTPLANLRQTDPSGLLTETPAVERFSGNTNYSNRQNRSTQTIAVGWRQPGLRFRRLYFEDQQIERLNAQRQFPNFAAGTNFTKSLILFPIRLVTGR